MQKCRHARWPATLILGVILQTAAAHSAAPPPACGTRAKPTLPFTPLTCAAPAATLRHAQLPPGGALKPRIAGGGTDYVVLNTRPKPHPAHPIAAVTGSFDLVTGLKTVVLRDSHEPGIYSLQINSNFFPNPAACAHAANPAACSAWVQFVYSSRPPGYLAIWYFLLNYGPKCPTVPPGSLLSGPWRSGDNNCANTSAAPTLLIPVTDLAQITLTGTAAAGGLDTITLTYHGAQYTASVEDSVLGLANNWTQAQFNIVADGDGDQAVFNPGATIVTRTAVTDSYSGPPNWQKTGFTAETNNLNLAAAPKSLPACPPHTAAIVTTESTRPHPTPYTPKPCQTHPAPSSH